MLCLSRLQTVYAMGFGAVQCASGPVGRSSLCGAKTYLVGGDLLYVLGYGG